MDTFGIASRFGQLADVTLKLVPLRKSSDFEGFADLQMGVAVPDLERVIAIAVRHGGRQHGRLHREQGVRLGCVRDPDGNTIELYQRVRWTVLAGSSKRKPLQTRSGCPRSTGGRRVHSERMANPRSSRPESGLARGRRLSQRRASSSNHAGIIVGAGAGVVVVAAVAAMMMIGDNPEKAPSQPTQEEPDKPATRQEPISVPEKDSSPDRPAPELKGTTIIAADALFRRVRSFHNAALAAKEAGDPDGYSEGMDGCWEAFKKLDYYLGDHTRWLADAKAKGWPIPYTYNTLEKRVAKYDKLRARIPRDEPPSP